MTPADTNCCLGCCHIKHAAIAGGIVIVLQLGVLFGIVLAYGVIPLSAPPQTTHFQYGSVTTYVSPFVYYPVVGFTVLLFATSLAAGVALAGLAVRKPWLLTFVIVLMAPTILVFVGIGIFLSLEIAGVIDAFAWYDDVWVVVCIVLSFAFALEFVWLMFIFIKAKAYMRSVAETNEQIVYPAHNEATRLTTGAATRKCGYASLYDQPTSIAPTLETKTTLD